MENSKMDDFKRSNWKLWIQRFEIYFIAYLETDHKKEATLLYNM